MSLMLRYGSASSIHLEMANGGWAAECGMPGRAAVEDVRATVVEALARPLEYPSLASATIPGDRIVLAIEPGVPQVDRVVAAVVEYLRKAGVGADGLAVLRSSADAADPRTLVPKEVGDQIALYTHDPTDSNSLGYLAATEEGRPILLNRAILDADVVLPIGCLGRRKAPEYHGIHGAIYPTFSDQQTLTRFRSLRLLNPRDALKKDLVKLCNQVGWLLGLSFTIQVVPGAGEEVLHVVAGEVSAVRRRARELYQEAWTSTVPRRASLVLAGIAGGSSQQTWHNLGEALAGALGLVEEGGSIAVCCDLAEEPGPAVRRVAEAPSRREALAKIRKELPEDAVIAAQLADALDRGEVYLLSRLGGDLVEQLEIAPVGGPDEIVRLARHHASCIVLANAAHAIVRAED